MLATKKIFSCNFHMHMLVSVTGFPKTLLKLGELAVSGQSNKSCTIFVPEFWHVK